MPAAGRSRLGQALELGVDVQEPQRDRAARRHSMKHARLDHDSVGFDLLPLAAPVAPLTPLELTIDQIRIEREPRGKPFHDRRESWSVRFAGSEVAQHHRLFDVQEPNFSSVSRSYAST